MRKNKTKKLLLEPRTLIGLLVRWMRICETYLCKMSERDVELSERDWHRTIKLGRLYPAIVVHRTGKRVGMTATVHEGNWDQEDRIGHDKGNVETCHDGWVHRNDHNRAREPEELHCLLLKILLRVSGSSTKARASRKMVRSKISF